MDEKIFDVVNADDIAAYLVGKKVKLKDDIEYVDDRSAHNVGINDEMRQYENSVVTVKKIRGSSYNVFLIYEDDEEWNWNLEFIDYIIDEKEETKITEDTPTKSNIKKGDLVRFKNIEDTTRSEKTFYGIPVFGKEVKINHTERKGEFVVCDVVGDKVLPYYIDSEYDPEPIDISIVELVEENFIDNILAKKRISEKNKKIIEDIKVIEEMKSKVNIKDFKKIYAGAMGRIPNNLKGIEQIIHQWAFNKKDIYRVLGNKLSITKEVMANKDASMVETDKADLIKRWPGIYYVMKNIRNSEILNNKLEHKLDYEWNQYSGNYYKSGEKVSKVIDEAFHNNELNIALSDIIAQSKVTGIVELSIDPIEYLLMSCNASGWSSCHTIYKNSKRSYGCYSAGIFSYMCDDVSLIAFRHDGKLRDYKIENQKVQAKSKNWRQMVWLSPTMKYFMTSRQYPCNNEELTKTVREMLEETIDNENAEINWVHSDNLDKMQECISNKRYKNTIYALHYNDILSGYTGDFMYKKDVKDEKKMIVVGSNPVCPNCGEKLMINSGHPECDYCYTHRD